MSSPVQKRWGDFFVAHLDVPDPVSVDVCSLCNIMVLVMWRVRPQSGFKEDIEIILR